MSEAVAFLRRERPAFIDLDVRVDGAVVRSRYLDRAGDELQSFTTAWADPSEPRSEYMWGLSIVHDVKDHALYGIGFTPLTEIQTIVQTYSGRGGDYVAAIRAHIAHEMFAFGGRPLVYDPAGQRGLFELFAPDASPVERRRAYAAMLHVAEQIMLPELLAIYDANPAALALQTSIRAQPALQAALLANVVWCDRTQLLMRLTDNPGFASRVRAYIDPELAAASARIAREVATYAAAHDLARFGRIFETRGHLLSEAS